MTHDERVLALLADGKWHTHHELYALYVVAHSRVASLRKKGHVIECERDGKSYRYRLLARDGLAAPSPASSPPLVGQTEDPRAGARTGSPAAQAMTRAVDATSVCTTSGPPLREGETGASPARSAPSSEGTAIPLPPSLSGHPPHGPLPQAAPPSPTTPLGSHPGVGAGQLPLFHERNAA